MRTQNILLCLALMVVASVSTTAQNGEVLTRDQADGWYLPVHGEVTIDGLKAEGVTVKVFKENADLGTFTSNKAGKFDVELDLDAVYTLLICKPGYENKMIFVDAHLPEGLVTYPAYECFVNLVPEGSTTAADPLYLDFPSAIVRYDADLGGYYHSEAYLEHINNKLHSIAKAEF
jgi:hypothetical protein